MIKRVLLDLDGVLVNFVNGVCEFHNKPWPYTPGEQGPWDLEPVLGLTPKQLWDPLGYEFWAGLDPYPYMGEFVSALENKFGRENICLLTTPPKTPGSVEGKMSFIREQLPQFRRQFLIGPAKQFCAGPEHLLVDDNEDNVRKFREAGGHAFLVPGPWNFKFNEEPLGALHTFLATL